MFSRSRDKARKSHPVHNSFFRCCNMRFKCHNWWSCGDLRATISIKSRVHRYLWARAKCWQRRQASNLQSQFPSYTFPECSAPVYGLRLYIIWRKIKESNPRQSLANGDSFQGCSSPWTLPSILFICFFWPHRIMVKYQQTFFFFSHHTIITHSNDKNISIMTGPITKCYVINHTIMN